MLSLKTLSLIVLLLPLLGSITALFKRVGVALTVILMVLSFAASLILVKALLIDQLPEQTYALYDWALLGNYHFVIGLLLDKISASMILVVTFVSLLVHIYSIGYMHNDPGYRRFFSYVSFFTFAMLSLVAADNVVMLFFGWEGVGLASYLLIGFWFHKDSAVKGSLKAFIVNRVGDVGFLLAIAALMTYFGAVDYVTIFANAPETTAPYTLISLLLFIGAAAKSAQIPLHVWLPESMEGPTPISALIHAATMVTAGVYMLCRMSPILTYAPSVSSLILIVGAATALSMGLLGLVQNDIKRVIAYSTISQLGYMIMAVGAGAYNQSLFHLFTHASFKALLFLAAGSVIIGMHHEQDMRKMGGLWRRMPITWMSFLVGALALLGLPPFSGFYSKDSILEALHASHVYGAHFAYICALLGAMVTALYTFRCFFMTFHGTPRFNSLRHPVKESPWVMLLPLVLLAIPSILLGWLMIHQQWLPLPMPRLFSPAFVMDIVGILLASVVVFYPRFPAALSHYLSFLHKVLLAHYGFDAFNQACIVKPTHYLSHYCYRVGDKKIIDGYGVQGSAKVFMCLSRLTQRLQSGYLYHYAAAMVVGLFVLLGWLYVVN